MVPRGTVAEIGGFTVSRMSRTGGRDVAVAMRDCGKSTTSRTCPVCKHRFSALPIAETTSVETQMVLLWRSLCSSSYRVWDLCERPLGAGFRSVNRALEVLRESGRAKALAGFSRHPSAGFTEGSLALSSTWCESDPNTACVVCISICPYCLIWYPYAPTSLYGNTAHCSGYGVAMGCYRLCIVPRTALMTPQWYDRYCYTEYARTWARHPTTHWQRECTAITDCQSTDSL